MDSRAKKRSERLHSLEILTANMVEFFAAFFVSSAFGIIIVNAFLGHKLTLWN